MGDENEKQRTGDFIVVKRVSPIKGVSSYSERIPATTRECCVEGRENGVEKQTKGNRNRKKEVGNSNEKKAKLSSLNRGHPAR